MGLLGDLVDTVDNAGAHVFGGLGWEGAADDQRNELAAQGKQFAQQQQAAIAQNVKGLNVSGYDSPAISECVNWDGYSHADIYKTNEESIKPSRVGESAQAWVTLAEKLRERGTNYSRDLGEIVRGGWQGEAAEAAAEVGKPASEWMIASADAFQATGENLRIAGDAAGESKNLVPKPEGFSWGETAASAVPFGLAGGGINALSQMEAQEEAEKAARETMGRVYSPTLTQVDAKMPQYTAPDGSTANPPPVSPPPGTDWGGGPGNGGNVPGGSGAGSGAGGGYSGSGMPGGSGGIPGGGYSGGAYPGGTSPAGTGTAWANPPGGGAYPGGMPPGAGGAGGAAGGAGGFGLAGGLGAGAGAGMGAGGKAGGVGGAGGGAGARGAGMGAGGRAGAGGLGAGAGAGAAGAGAGGRGAAGRGGMGGMGAGAGRRGEGSEDDEHERPSWLEEQDDVWMNDMPKTAPPVLGE
ncbi:PPE domain-containing protein [Saccharopolyspora flava]|uniref:PPE domain-containing protein n=1 Tax=Saccharopolyspora flava TaxID=95161 RepID=UPI000B806FC4|nr:PPE domain-containing protein [Saccharopolyspora flava]